MGRDCGVRKLNKWKRFRCYAYGDYYNRFGIQKLFRMENSFSMKVRTTPKPQALTRPTFNVREDRKYLAQTMTQNFFTNSNQPEDYNAIYRQVNTAPRKKTPEESGQKVRTSRKKRDSSIKLQPMKQTEKIDIFQSLGAKNYLDDIEEIVISTPKKQVKKEEEMPSKDRTKLSSRRLNKKIDFIEEFEVPTIYQAFKQQKTNHEPHLFKKIDHTESQLLFDERQSQKQQKLSQICEKEAMKNNHQDQIVIALTKRTFDYDFKEEQEQEHQKEEPSVVKEIANNPTCSDYFTFGDEASFIRQLTTAIDQNVTLSMQIIRDKSGFNSFWPEYHLQFAQDRLHVLSAKKTSSRPSSTFIISRSNHDFQENSPFYFGKVKSNAFGESYNIYGPGLNPDDAKEKRVTPRQLLATVVYSTSLFHKNGPRKFSVYIKRPQLKYYENFLQVKKYGQEIPLNVLHQYIDNKQKVRILHNRLPKYNQKIGGYQPLNFRGKADRPSVKNFILEETPNGSDILLFGKSNEDTYNLEISMGISPHLAFAIAISTFDNRLLYE